VLRIRPQDKFPEITNEKEFFRVVKVGFSAKRKQMHNNLANGFKLSSQQVEQWLADNKINVKARAQDLSVKDWVNLYLSLPG
jgi:16S rRNA (adenine1518-N6/adenine1519-N6)-dimethyltransferase